MTSPAIPAKPSVSNKFFLIATLSSVIGLSMLLYAVAFQPASANKLFVILAVSLCFFPFLFTLVGFTLSCQVNGVKALPTATFTWVFAAFFACFGLAFPLQVTSVASKNLDGEIPLIAQQASNQVRANPFNVPRVVSTLRPAMRYSSLRKEDVNLFLQASGAGLDTPAISRVMSNGFVSAQDKEELLNSLVEAYSTQPASGKIAALITAVSAQ